MYGAPQDPELALRIETIIDETLPWADRYARASLRLRLRDYTQWLDDRKRGVSVDPKATLALVREHLIADPRRARE